MTVGKGPDCTAVVEAVQDVNAVHPDVVPGRPTAKWAPDCQMGAPASWLLKELDGTMWLVGAMLYGTGVRLEECLERVRATTR